MLSCLKATELIERKLHFHLSFTEKLQLKMHKMMCDACSLYDKQSTIIEHSIAHQFGSEAKHIDTEDLQKEILQRLAHPGNKV